VQAIGAQRYEEQPQGFRRLVCAACSSTSYYDGSVRQPSFEHRIEGVLAQKKPAIPGR
jgi:hypothetical protein